MGFNVKSLPKTVCVEREYTVIDEITQAEETTRTKHYLRLPTPAEREEYNRRTTRVKGKKIDNNISKANQYLWVRCIQKVEGYDNLPEDERAWKAAFLENVILQIHVDEAIQDMMGRFMGEEAEHEKKSELSSEK